MTRSYLPTFAELIDRLTIVQLKAIFISEHKTEYEKEIALIMSDIDSIIMDKPHTISANDIRAIAVLAISNRVIWEAESKARAGGDEQDKNLKFTHSINGVRNTAKNIIAAGIGDRLDYKVDALSETLDPEFGNWRIW